MSAIKEGESEEVRKMFVGGITADTTEDELKEYFGEFGEIESTVILKKETQDSKPKRFFGFVTFAEMESLDKAFLKRPHTMKNILLEVKHAVPKGNTHPGATLKTKKLFIANLSPTTTKEDIQNYLESRHPNQDYGTIEEINLIKKKDGEGNDTEELKGYGFIQVSTEDFADKLAIHDNKFELNSRTIELKKSEPRGRGGFGGGRGGRGGGGRGGFGGGRGGYQGGWQGGYGGGYGGGFADPYGYYAGGYGYGQGGRYKPY